MWETINVYIKDLLEDLLVTVEYEQQCLVKLLQSSSTFLYEAPQIYGTLEQEYDLMRCNC